MSWREERPKKLCSIWRIFMDFLHNEKACRKPNMPFKLFLLSVGLISASVSSQQVRFCYTVFRSNSTGHLAGVNNHTIRQNRLQGFGARPHQMSVLSDLSRWSGFATITTSDMIFDGYHWDPIRTLS